MRPKSTTPRAAANGAFTLIELMVVIAIILLLAGILVPTVSSALRMGHKADCMARLRDLSAGCDLFKRATHYYPGQQDLTTWTIGANVLARDLFTDGGAYPTSKYASYKATDLLDLNGLTADRTDDAIWDRFTGDKLPVLYYPSRVNEGSFAQFKVTDNSTIAGAWTTTADFEAYITDDRFGTDNIAPYMNGEFLLISAGEDGNFITPDGDDDDNLTNWNQ